MVLTSLVGFLFLFVWWSSFINKRQQLSGSSALVTPGKQTVCSSFSASLLAWRGPHEPRGQSSVTSLQGGAGAATPGRASSLCSKVLQTVSSGNTALGSPQQCSSLSPSLGLGENKRETTWGVSWGGFSYAAVARIAVGISSSLLEDSEENESQLFCGQGIEAALSSSWPCWALRTALWLIAATCFKHRVAHKRQ